MVEEVQQMKAAEVLGGETAGATLAGLSTRGSGEDRLAAVVALLASGFAVTGTPVRGAFAQAGPTATKKVRTPFTSALHGCLREEAVNAAPSAAIRSA